MQETEAFAVLTSIPYLGAIRIRFLVEKFGSALNALQTPTEQLEKLAGFDRILPHWNQWSKNTIWQNDLALVEKLGAELIPFTSPLFPKSLLEIPDHPALLYVQGELKSQDQHSIAIVGTRNASIYGNEMAHQIARDLASHGFSVISGLARGVDTSAHRGALERGGRTLAVIGSGLADIYPPENRELAQEISQKGVLISEFGMATPPDRQNFPQRNRIVSGMTLATLLIEAPIKSGAMITMEKALTQKRKLFALPGRADNENFRGNHTLIKNGKAQLIENAADILCHFEGLFPLPSIKRSGNQTFIFDKQETSLLNKMTQEEIGIDDLALLTNLPVNQVHTTLMGLVLKKIVKEFPGKLYKKIIETDKPAHRK
ncbi:MAG TPA: DNA-processing protein DprA [Parachlamydiaceae bacterium]|nr:DNA-processing protein DprA [Parachlamydiaceae bacterium]